MLSAKIEGREYQIPQAWLCGFLTGHKGATAHDAVCWWHEQELMAEELEAQRQAA